MNRDNEPSTVASTLRVLSISGSLRHRSYNRMLLHAASEDTGRGDVADEVTIRERLDRYGGHETRGHDEEMPHALEVRTGVIT